MPHGLAEAEVEYEDDKSPSIYVKFEVASDISQALPSLKGKKVYFVIWTTTPWTIPANLAIALNPELDYVAVEIDNSDVLILAEGLLTECMTLFGYEKYCILEKFKPIFLENLKAKHPLYDRDSLVVLADYVTLDAGTGCVHTAPGHGREDYETGLRYGLDIYSPVDATGHFTPDVEFLQVRRYFLQIVM
jgi:isoleucyl-tRNA synthetase